MKAWTMRKAAWLTVASVALLCGPWLPGAMPEAAAQTAAPASQAPAASNVPPVDEFDRVAMLWYRQRLAKSGAARGEEIFFMSCWICHNEYTISTTKIHAPSLKDLFASGQSFSDDAIMETVRSGGVRMPAYSPGLLNDQDLRDLVAFLRARCATSKGSCFDETNPPANPRYKAQ
jgi:mono/diheme cytochrome c family protein